MCYTGGQIVFTQAKLESALNLSIYIKKNSPDGQTR